MAAQLQDFGIVETTRALDIGFDRTDRPRFASLRRIESRTAGFNCAIVGPAGRRIGPLWKVSAYTIEKWRRPDVRPGAAAVFDCARQMEFVLSARHRDEEKALLFRLAAHERVGVYEPSRRWIRVGAADRK